MFRRLSAWWNWILKFVVLPIYLTVLLFGVSTWIAQMTPSQRKGKLVEGLEYGAVFVVAKVVGALLNAASHSSE
jgi:ABC-type transport system involved in cytochrome c biogenesis permease component